jgi:hypothetical protein
MFRDWNFVDLVWPASSWAPSSLREVPVEELGTAQVLGIRELFGGAPPSQGFDSHPACHAHLVARLVASGTGLAPRSGGRAGDS